MSPSWTSRSQRSRCPHRRCRGTPTKRARSRRRPLAARLKQSLDNMQATNEAREAASKGNASEPSQEEDQPDVSTETDKRSGELAKRVGNELLAMVDEIEAGGSSDSDEGKTGQSGPGSRSATPRNRQSSPLPFVHPKELTSQKQTLTVEREAERAPNIIYYNDQKVYPSKHPHTKKIGSEFPVESLVVPLGISVIY